MATDTQITDLSIQFNQLIIFMLNLSCWKLKLAANENNQTQILNCQDCNEFTPSESKACQCDSTVTATGGCGVYLSMWADITYNQFNENPCKIHPMTNGLLKPVQRTSKLAKLGPMTNN